MSAGIHPMCAGYQRDRCAWNQCLFNDPPLLSHTLLLAFLALG
jgi:hypothetical protein